MTSPQTRLKVDLHTHTDLSKDGGQSPDELVEAAISHGFDAIAVTDHNTVEGSLRAEHYAKGRIIVFPGQETMTDKGEIVVLNVRETLPTKMDLEETVRLAREKGGFVIVPHPFDLMRKGIGDNMDRILEHVDAIEAFNSRTIWTRFNRRAMEYAKSMGKPTVAGSDSHFPDEIGKTYMLVSSSRDPKDILSSILAGRVELVTRAQSRCSKLMRGFRKLRTYLPSVQYKSKPPI
jgi:predicted metal-dependent phosphoesterase TrpH